MSSKLSCRFLVETGWMICCFILLCFLVILLNIVHCFHLICTVLRQYTFLQSISSKIKKHWISEFKQINLKSEQIFIQFIHCSLVLCCHHFIQCVDTFSVSLACHFSLDFYCNLIGTHLTIEMKESTLLYLHWLSILLHSPDLHSDSGATEEIILENLLCYIMSRFNSYVDQIWLQMKMISFYSTQFIKTCFLQPGKVFSKQKETMKSWNLLFVAVNWSGWNNIKI